MNKCIFYFACFLIYPLVFIFIYDVVNRYFLSGASIWGIELVWMLTGSSVFLGGAYVLKENGHVRADIIYQKVSARGKFVLDLIGYMVFFFPFMFFMIGSCKTALVNSYIHAESSAQTSWLPLMWPCRMVLLISMIVLLLQGAVELLRSMSAYFTPAAAIEEDEL
jgi:TRAP-type mannitol/chloroaromatic compound transport system permease small subunit